MLEVRLDGADALRRAAEDIRRAGDKDRSRAMGRALANAAEPTKVAIREEAAATMPQEGGYRAVFLASLAFRMSRRFAGRVAQVILRTYADGTSERRDIKALNRGILRHPVWGRSRDGSRRGERIANPWAVTSIPADFFGRGTQKAADAAEREMGKVIEQLAKDASG